MIRIGLVNLDVSHPKAFSEYLKKDGRARYVAIYNDGFREDDEVEGFIKNYGLEKRCDTVDELAEMSDIGFIQGCNWAKHLNYVMPFIKRNKPVFIDKPIVGSLADCKKIEKLVADGAVILGSSSVRYCQEVVEFANMPEEEKGEILNLFGTAGVDEFNYGIHIVEALGGIMGTGAESCTFVGSSTIDSKVCETFFVKFNSGATATYNTFHGLWQPFEIVAMTTKGTFQFRVDTSKIYGALLDRICDFMETGKNDLAPIEDLTESIKIMLAGKASRDKGGVEVKLSDIPQDCAYDGDLFEEGYAAKATKIYL